VSVRLRLTLWHTALLGLMLTGFAVLVYAAVARQLTIELNDQIRLGALAASRAFRAVGPDTGGLHGGPARFGGPPRGGFEEGPPGPPPNGGLATAPPDQGLFIQVVDVNGTVLSMSPNLAQPLPIPADSLRQVLAGREAHDTVQLGRDRVELYSAPLVHDGRVVGVLQVAASLEPLEASLAELRLVLGLVVLAAVGVAAVLGWFLAGKALQPVDQMTRVARAIGHSTDLSQRVPVSNPRDELGRLAATFNEMLAQLQQAFENQRRFLADASHELRTPVTTIRMNAEALLRGAAYDPRERDETLRAILRESERMGRLVADLLALARADAGQPLERRPLALDSLLLEVYREAKPLANGVQLELGELEQVEVVGDHDRLKQLVLNLVDNALRYTPAGGKVTLDLVGQDGRALLRVRDTGPGIPAEHLPRIFERFYRVDRGRSRSQGGTGLGLAISQWIAEAHQGRIEVESEEGKGSTFTVVLPIHKPGVSAPVAPRPVQSGAAIPR